MCVKYPYQHYTKTCNVLLSFIIPRVVQIMSIIFQTGHALSIVLGNESTSASARMRFPSTIE
jgi:hypothetical protein